MPVRVAGRRDHAATPRARRPGSTGRGFQAKRTKSAKTWPDSSSSSAVSRRHAVAEEPVGDPARPVARAPDPLALRVVEPALQDGRTGRGRGRLGAADVVGVHVRDEDPHDRRVEAGGDLRPRGLRQAEARVDERPAVVAAEEVAVDVARAGRQRQRQAEDPRLQLDRDERVFGKLAPRGCASSIAKSRAAPRSTACAACRSSGRSTRTWAAPTAARSATSAPSRRAPTGRGTNATARASA